MNKIIVPAILLGLTVCGCASVDVYREDDVDGLKYLSDQSSNPYFIDYTVGEQRV